MSSRAAPGRLPARDARVEGHQLGCDTSSCGACTVLMDGAPANPARCSPSRPRVPVTTIEGLADGRAASRPAGVPRAARAAVRLLHAGHDHGHRVASAGVPEPDRSDIRHGARGQPLPLHGLPQHRPARSRPAARAANDPRLVRVCTRQLGRGCARAPRPRRGCHVARRRAIAHPDDEAPHRPPEHFVDIGGLTTSRYVARTATRCDRRPHPPRDARSRPGAGRRARCCRRPPSSSAIRRFVIGGPSVARSHTRIRRPISARSSSRSTPSLSPAGRTASARSRRRSSSPGRSRTPSAPHELLTEIRVPAIERGVYLKYQRSARDWATVGVAAADVGGPVQVALAEHGADVAAGVCGRGSACRRRIAGRAAAERAARAPSHRRT